MLAVLLVFVMLTLVVSDTVQLTLVRFEATAAHPLLRPPPNAMNCCELPTLTVADGGEIFREEKEQFPLQADSNDAQIRIRTVFETRLNRMIRILSCTRLMHSSCGQQAIGNGFFTHLSCVKRHHYSRFVVSSPDVARIFMHTTSMFNRHRQPEAMALT